MMAAVVEVEDEEGVQGPSMGCGKRLKDCAGWRSWIALEVEEAGVLRMWTVDG